MIISFEILSFFFFKCNHEPWLVFEATCLPGHFEWGANTWKWFNGLSTLNTKIKKNSKFKFKFKFKFI